MAPHTTLLWLAAAYLCLAPLPQAQSLNLLRPGEGAHANTLTHNATADAGRKLRASVDDWLESSSFFGQLDDHVEMKPHDGETDTRFFEPPKKSVVDLHTARENAKKARREKAQSHRRKARQKERAEGLEEGGVQEAETEATSEAEVEAISQAEAVAAAEDEGFVKDEPVEDAVEEEEAPKKQKAKASVKVKDEPVEDVVEEEEAPKRQKAKASVKRRAKLRTAHLMPPENKKLVPDIDCKVYILDLHELAEAEGIPSCDPNSFAAHPLTQRLLPNPAVVDPSTATLNELKSGGGEMRWSFPYTAWPHYLSQHAGPWYIQENLKNTKMHTTNISEAHVVLVDDYCYLMWAMADLRAKYHWWLDGAKHYKSNFTAGKHLIDVYHAMAHQRDYMHKQGRNFLFITPLTAFDFGDWHIMDNYAGMSCDHFSNSMHIVSDQAQRWRCGRYRADRMLVAPLSSTEITALPDPDADRDILLYFRGLCDPDGGNDPNYAAKRLRRYMVKVLSESDDTDFSVSCTNEDLSGKGPGAVDEHHIRPHEEYLEEMRRSVYCIIIPADAQNTPRLTEAFLSGCVPVFLGPPWHAMPYPDMVDWRAAAIHIHFADISRWASFGAKWSLEKNAPRDASRLHPKWWTPQVSPKDTEELHDMEHLPDFLRNYPQEKLKEKQAAVARFRRAFVYDKEPQQPPAAADIALQQACKWGAEESVRHHEEI